MNSPGSKSVMRTFHPTALNARINRSFCTVGRARRHMAGPENPPQTYHQNEKPARGLNHAGPKMFVEKLWESCYFVSCIVQRFVRDS